MSEVTVQIHLGAKVRIHGLVGTPEHNGATGAVVKYVADRGRWGVKITSGTVLSMKPENLIVVWPAGLLSEPTGDQFRLVHTAQELVQARNWLSLADIADELLRTAQDHRAASPGWAGWILQCLGVCYQKLGQCTKAIELYQECLEIYLLETNDPAGVRRAWGGLALSYKTLSEYNTAIACWKQFLSGAKAVGDRAGQGTALAGMGICYSSLGHHTKAIVLLEQALSVDEELGNRAGQRSTLANLGDCYRSLGQHAKANEYITQSLKMEEEEEEGNRARQGRAFEKMGNYYQSVGQYANAIEYHEQRLTIATEVGDRAEQGFAWGSLGICYGSFGQYTKAIEHLEQSLKIATEVGDRAMQGNVSSNLGIALAKNGDDTGAARVLLRGLAVWQSVEEDVGPQDDRRISLFEQQQQTYTLLQDVFMRQEGRAGWALGVAAEGKARAPAYRLGAVSESHGGGGDSEDGEQLADRPYEDVCESWWVEVQRLARGEGAKTRVIEFSFLRHGNLGIWVLSGDTGELLSSKVVSSTGLAGSRGLSIQEALAELRKSMGVRGRDAMREARDALCASTREATDLLDASHATDEPASSVRGIATKEDLERKKVQTAREILSKLVVEVEGLCDKIFVDLMVHREGMAYRKMPSVVSWFQAHCLRQEGEHMAYRKMPSLVPTLYELVQNLLQEARIRVEESHPDKLGKEDSIDDLQERETLLWVSRDALDEVLCEIAEMLLKELYQTLIAPVEAALEGAEELLIMPHQELFEVPWAALTGADKSYLIERYVIRTAPSLRVARQAADKMHQHGNQPRGHVVLVGNPLPIPTRFTSLPDAEKEARHINEILERAQVVLQSKHIYFGPNLTRFPTKTHVKESLEGADWAHLACHADIETDALVLADASDGADQDSNLTMHEVQGSERAQGVRLAQGATVVLSACNTARGEIKAEGVVGLSRGFLLANASATVVSLWSVDDGSTAALMRIKYSHLAQGCTVPKALRLAMLRLARRPPQKLGQKQTRDRAAGAGVSDDSESSETSQDEHCDELEETWKQPRHWAAFLVVGATTSLRRHSTNHPTAAGSNGMTNGRTQVMRNQGAEDGGGHEEQVQQQLQQLQQQGNSSSASAALMRRRQDKEQRSLSVRQALGLPDNTNTNIRTTI